MELLAEAHIGLAEVPLWPIDLAQADEASSPAACAASCRWCASTAAAIGDGTPGPITRRVMALYEALVRRATTPPTG